MPASTIRHRNETSAPRPRSKGGAGAFLIVIVAMLAIGGGIFALIHFLAESPKTDNEMLAFLPPDSNLVVSVDFDELAKTEKLREFEESLPGTDPEVFTLIAKGGLRKNISNMMLGVHEFHPRTMMPTAPKAPGTVTPGAGAQPPRTSNPLGEPASIVFRTRQPVDKAKLIAAWSGGEVRKGDKIYYIAGATAPAAVSLRFFFPTDTLIVFTRNDKVLEKIITGDRSKPAISTELQEVVKRVSRAPIWFAMTRRLLMEKTYFEIKDEGGNPFLTDDTIEGLKHLEWIGGWLKLDGDRVQFTLNMSCDEAAFATRVHEKAKQLVEDLRTVSINENPRIAAYRKKYPTRIVSPVLWEACYEIQRTAKVGMNGNAVEIQAQCNAEALVPLLKELTTIRIPAGSPLPGMPMQGPNGGGEAPPPKFGKQQ